MCIRDSSNSAKRLRTCKVKLLSNRSMRTAEPVTIFSYVTYKTSKQKSYKNKSDQIRTNQTQKYPFPKDTYLKSSLKSFCNFSQYSTSLYGIHTRKYRQQNNEIALTKLNEASLNERCLVLLPRLS